MSSFWPRSCVSCKDMFPGRAFLGNRCLPANSVTSGDEANSWPLWSELSSPRPRHHMTFLRKGGPGSLPSCSPLSGQMTWKKRRWPVLGFRPAECSQSAHICKPAKWAMGRGGGASPLHPQDPPASLCPSPTQGPPCSLPTSSAGWSFVPQRKPAPN